MIFPGNFLSGVVYFPVISPPAVFISLLFSLTTAAAVSSYYIIGLSGDLIEICLY